LFLNHFNKENNKNCKNKNLELSNYPSFINKISKLHKEHFNKMRQNYFDPSYVSNEKTETFILDKKLLENDFEDDHISTNSENNFFYSPIQNMNKSIQLMKSNLKIRNSKNNIEKSMINSSTTQEDSPNKVENKQEKISWDPGNKFILKKQKTQSISPKLNTK
jgi:hypothetical protein